MLRTPTAFRAATAILAATAVLALPGPASANVRHRAESAYDTTSPKSVTASCPPGEVLIGTGARVTDGEGGVRLDAVIPTGTSVEARAEAFPGHAGAWSVVVAAFCASASFGPSTVAVSPADSSTATCPAGTVVSGTGFDLPDGVPLTGLVPDEEGGSVTVRTALLPIGASRVAYAVCVPGSRASESWGGPHYLRFEATSPVDTSARKVVTVRRMWDWQFPSISGAGAAITVFRDPTDPFPVPTTGVFIDVLMPSADGSRVTVEAVRRATGEPVRRLAGGGGDDPWSVTGYGTDHDIY